MTKIYQLIFALIYENTVQYTCEIQKGTLSVCSLSSPLKFILRGFRCTLFGPPLFLKKTREKEHKHC